MKLQPKSATEVLESLEALFDSLPPESEAEAGEILRVHGFDPEEIGRAVADTVHRLTGSIRSGARKSGEILETLEALFDDLPPDSVSEARDQLRASGFDPDGIGRAVEQAAKQAIGQQIEQPSITFGASDNLIHVRKTAGLPWVDRPKERKLAAEVLSRCRFLIRNLHAMTGSLSPMESARIGGSDPLRGMNLMPSASPEALPEETESCVFAGSGILAILLVRLLNERYELQVLLADEEESPIKRGTVRWRHGNRRGEILVTAGMVRVTSCRSGIVELSISIPDRPDLFLQAHFEPMKSGSL